MISIIVPVYKVEPYLHQCLDSIIGQTYTEIEVILIDDGSPDACGEICEKYARKDERIRVFHTENKGLSAARNLGIQEAQGDYIGFVDSDDWIEPDMYNRLLTAINETNADISICGFTEELASSSRINRIDEAVYSCIEALDALLEEKISNTAWNKLYSRELFKEILFPEGKNYEDIAVIQQILYKANRVAVISALGYHYRMREESITKSYTASNLIDFADAYFCRYTFFREELSDQFKDNQEVLLRCAAKGISKVWRWWYGCSRDEKQSYAARIQELERFSKENFPLLGFNTWPVHLRVSTFFMHSSNGLSFALLYVLNQIYRRIWPERGNAVIDE